MRCNFAAICCDSLRPDGDDLGADPIRDLPGLFDLDHEAAADSRQGAQRSDIGFEVNDALMEAHVLRPRLGFHILALAGPSARRHL